MTPEQWLSIMLVAVVHTAALFRWAGRIDVMLGEHNRRIDKLEKKLEAIE